MILYSYSGIVECSKSAEFPKFIRNLAWELNLKLEIDIDETGWIFKKQTTRFKVIGEKEKVMSFVSSVNESIADYQSRVSRPGISGVSGYGISGYREGVSGYGISGLRIGDDE